MQYKIEDFYNAIDEIAEFSSSESWDNSGLLIGSPRTAVNSALLALDVTSGVIAEARLLGANLIITHHPVIFPHIDHIDGDGLICELICAGIGVISAHTNYDMAEEGVNSTLCGLLGLRNARVLESGVLPGLGRLGELEAPMRPNELAAFVKERLGAGCVKYTDGDMISTLAVCSGSGGELWRDAAAQNCQALVTSEVKHHLLLEAAHAKFTVIDAGHYSTEAPAMRVMAASLSRLLPGASVLVSKAQSDPASYL